MTEKHICVCICTFKRPELLRRCVEAVCAQKTTGLFTYSVVVVDNDEAESACAVVSHLRAISRIPLRYCVEPRQNIALARNKAVDNASGDFIAFLDDDEIPIPEWLLTLFKTLSSQKVDGVLGPVKPLFGNDAPTWVVRSKLYDRPSYPTGFAIDWKKGRTGNALLKREIFAGMEQPFRPQFRVGEDQDFFRRMIEKGYVFIWCDQAVAYEVVPPNRWRVSFLLRRALLRGASSPLQLSFGPPDIAKSVVAVPAYTAILPFSLILGRARFMTYLVKLFDHIGKLLAVVGLNPVKEGYVTE